MLLANAPGLVIAAPSSGAGKTLLTLGLLRAFSRAGRKAASAKAGPDYIDPRFHEAASGRVCFNLDGWAMRMPLVQALAAHAAHDSDIVLIEGVMGLFDGSASGQGSTADLAITLGLPVLLVVDAQAQAQSAAALVKGFAGFQEGCHVAGVIFNRVGSVQHEVILRRAMEPLNIPVLGVLQTDESIVMPSRHLGLVQAREHKTLDMLFDRAAELVEKSIDLDDVVALAREISVVDKTRISLPPLGQCIAVASDEAFAFSYPHLLEGWQSAGAQVVPFSPLADEGPDKTAGAIYLPGGYPELHASRLSGNTGFFDGLRQAASRGILIYGECGGFMALGEYLIDAEGLRHKMAGLLPLGTSFAEPGLHLGYRRLVHDNALPWPQHLRGHEFHYSTLHWQGEADTLFVGQDSRGEELGATGLRRGTVMGSYAHIVDMETAA